MLRRALLLVVFAALLAGCPEDRRKRIVPGGAVDLPDVATELVVDLQPPSAAIDGPVRLLLLGWEPAELLGGRPRPGGQPTFAWRSEGLKPQWPIRLALPIPPGTSVLVVRDDNINGRLDDGERVGGPLIAPLEPAGALPVVLDRAFQMDPGGERDAPRNPSALQDRVEPSDGP